MFTIFLRGAAGFSSEVSSCSTTVGVHRRWRRRVLFHLWASLIKSFFGRKFFLSVSSLSVSVLLSFSILQVSLPLIFLQKNLQEIMPAQGGKGKEVVGDLRIQSTQLLLESRTSCRIFCTQSLRLLRSENGGIHSDREELDDSLKKLQHL